MGIEPGPRDHLVTRALERDLSPVDPDLVVERALDPAEGPERLARHAMGEIRHQLADYESAELQAERTNILLGDVASGDSEDGKVALPPRVLHGIKRRTPLGDPAPLPADPATPFSQSDLLVNAEGQPNMGSELRAELATADSVDLICAFVLWAGVRHLRDALADVVSRGGRIRVITTTYMGTTEKRAVDELCSLGAEVRVAFDARTTKLHAKAWLLERGSGLSTAFVGSSNLSHSALFDGLEWNVRLSSVDAVHVIDRVRMMFESHWASEHFDAYDPERNGDELAQALRDYDRRSLGEVSTISFANLDVRPYPHQQRMLDASPLSANATIGTAIWSLRRPEPARRSSRLSIIASSWSETTLRCRSYLLPIARRFSGSRSPPIKRSCAEAISARSTAAAESLRASRIRNGPIPAARRALGKYRLTLSTWSLSTNSTTPQQTRMSASSNISAPASYWAHCDTGTTRWPRRHRVVRPPDHRGVAPVGSNRPGIPRAVPVLRRRRRN